MISLPDSCNADISIASELQAHMKADLKADPTLTDPLEVGDHSSAIARPKGDLVEAAVH